MLLPPLAAVFVPAVGCCCVAAWKQRPFRPEVWKPHYWLLLTHLLFFPVVIAVGVVCDSPLYVPSTSRNPNPTGTLLMESLWWVSLASCAFWIWRLRGIRWFSAGLMTLMEVPVLGALFIAGMSVSGDWI